MFLIKRTKWMQVSPPIPISNSSIGGKTKTTGFYVPWLAVVLAVSSVFAVVFTTMIYSMSKIKKDNPIDALRNENL